VLEIAKREAIRASEKQPCTWCGFVYNSEFQKLCSRTCCCMLVDSYLHGCLGQNQFGSQM
jgi:hypothetical protein